MTELQGIKEWAAAVIHKWGIPIASGIIVVITPIHPVLLVVILLVLANAFVGAWAASKNKEPVTITSFMAFAPKLFLYLFILIVFFFVEIFVWKGLVPAVTGISSAICVREGIILLKNSGVIIGEPIFKYVINKLNRDTEK